MASDKTAGAPGNKPDEQKKAVASGIAVAVVIILVVVWAFFFIRKVRDGVTLDQVGTSAQQEFQFQNVKEAQQDLQGSYGSAAEELKRLREEAMLIDPAEVDAIRASMGEGGDFGITE